MVFQAVRELLFNAVKHSGARRVHVRVATPGGRVWVAVRDDGVGFAPATATGGRTTNGFVGSSGDRARISLRGEL